MDNINWRLLYWKTLGSSIGEHELEIYESGKSKHNKQNGANTIQKIVHIKW